MKNFSIFFAALVAVLFSVTETSAQITPPYYNPANVRITGGNINGTVIGATTPSTGAFTTVNASSTIQVGSGSATNAGWIAGYLGASGYAGLWNTGIVPGVNNFALTSNGAISTVSGSTSASLKVNNSGGVTQTATLLTAATPLSVTDATDSSSTTTGSLKTAGGLGVVKKAYFGDSLNVASPGTLSVGSGSTTAAGLIAGYSGLSGYGAIWGTAVTPSTSNYAIISNGANSAINATTNVQIAISNIERANITSTNFSHKGDMIYDKTITAAGTTGAQTINKTTGRVNFAAAATSLTVTNSLVTANSIVHCTVATNDTTMKSAACVPGSGSFVIYANAAATAETAVAFTVTN